MEINWFLLVAQIVNFLVLLALLKRFLFGPIVSAMDEREAAREARLADAEAAQTKARTAAAELDRERQQLRDQKAELMAKARTEADAKREEWLTQARDEAARARDEWREGLRRAEAGFLLELRRAAARVVSAAARRALTDLAETTLEAGVARIFIRRLAALNEGQRELFRKAVRDTEETIVVRSAFPLAADVQTELTRALQQHAAAERGVRYETAPETVAGIEARVAGYRLAWSVDDYLTTLAEEFAAPLRKAEAAA